MSLVICGAQGAMAHQRAHHEHVDQRDSPIWLGSANRTPQQEAIPYCRTKTMIPKMLASIVLSTLVTLTAYDAQAAKLLPLIKIVSAAGVTYFIDAGKISGIVNSYALVREKTTDAGEIGLRSGPIKPHLLGIPGFPGGISIDDDGLY
jgi:hypothetical protein